MSRRDNRILVPVKPGNIELPSEFHTSDRSELHLEAVALQKQDPQTLEDFLNYIKSKDLSSFSRDNEIYDVSILFIKPEIIKSLKEKGLAQQLFMAVANHSEAGSQKSLFENLNRIIKEFDGDVTVVKEAAGAAAENTPDFAIAKFFNYDQSPELKEEILKRAFQSSLKSIGNGNDEKTFPKEIILDPVYQKYLIESVPGNGSYLLTKSMLFNNYTFQGNNFVNVRLPDEIMEKFLNAVNKDSPTSIFTYEQYFQALSYKDGGKFFFDKLKESVERFPRTFMLNLSHLETSLVPFGFGRELNTKDYRRYIDLVKIVEEKAPEAVLSNAETLLKLASKNPEALQEIKEILNRCVVKRPDAIILGIFRGAPYIKTLQDNQITAVKDLEVLNTLGKDAKLEDNQVLLSGYVFSTLTGSVEERAKKAIEMVKQSKNDGRDLYLHLLKYRGGENGPQPEAIEQGVILAAQIYTNTINNLPHENTARRFQSLKGMQADELLYLMRYGVGIMQTSTYRGVFERLSQTSSAAISEVFENFDDDSLRTVFRQAASFGTLTSRPGQKGILDYLTRTTFDKTIQRVFTGLEEGDRDKKEPLFNFTAAYDTILAINDKNALKLIAETLNNYLKENKEDFEDGDEVAYGLLGQTLVKKDSTIGGEIKELAEEYGKYLVTNVGRTDVDLILNKKEDVTKNGQTQEISIGIQRQVFFNDADGHTSYKALDAALSRNNGWQDLADADRPGILVRYKEADGKRIYIVANNPDYPESHEQIQKADLGASIFVQRGHTYYIRTALEGRGKDVAIDMYGACGGYNFADDFMMAFYQNEEEGKKPHVWFTRGIGTTEINTYLGILLAEESLAGKSGLVDSTIIYNKLVEKFKNNPRLAERLEDYIPPHKNTMLLLYSSLIEYEKSKRKR